MTQVMMAVKSAGNNVSDGSEVAGHDGAVMTQMTMAVKSQVMMVAVKSQVKMAVESVGGYVSNGGSEVSDDDSRVTTQVIIIVMTQFI